MCLFKFLTQIIFNQLIIEITTIATHYYYYIMISYEFFIPFWY